MCFHVIALLRHCVRVEEQTRILMKVVFIAIIAAAAAINYQKIIVYRQRQHRMMPNASMVIHALSAIAAKSAH